MLIEAYCLWVLLIDGNLIHWVFRQGCHKQFLPGPSSSFLRGYEEHLYLLADAYEGYRGKRRTPPEGEGPI